MRNLRMPLLAAAFTVLSTAPANADLGDQLFKLLPDDGAAFDAFGWSIAVDNGVVYVGAYIDDNDNGDSAGSAYLFDACTGAQLFKLLPNDGAAGDRFGFSIGIDNGIVAVGAFLDDDNGTRSGSAYVFNASTGAQIAKLLPSDGSASDQFGFSIAIDNGVVAVEAHLHDDNGIFSGSAYLFDACTGTQLFKLLADDGAPFDHFGYSIAIDNGIVAVGAWSANDNGTDSGSAYLFNVATGTQIVKLLPNDGDGGNRFGWSIAIDNGVVAVGAIWDDDNGTDSGSAYLFDASTFAQIAKLRANDGSTEDEFGRSIAIGNGVVAVGAHRDDDNGLSSGSAYLFDASTGAQIVKLLPNDGEGNDRFGTSVAISGATAIVGAPRDDDNGNSSGSAYVFDAAAPGKCPWDIDGSGDVGVKDLLFLLGAWGPCPKKGDCPADFDNSGDVGVKDLLTLLGAWGPCP